MRVLVSGFEPFDGMRSNPSSDILPLLEEKEFSFDLATTILPVSFERAFPLLKQKIDQVAPTHVISLGLAKNRKCLTVERVAINLIEARIPDNEGVQWVDKPIQTSGPDGLFTTLPIKNMVEASERAGCSATVSNSAGTYLCNMVMYESLYYSKKADFFSGFVHLPPCTRLCTDGESMEKMADGLSAILTSLVGAQAKSSRIFGAES